MNAKEQILSKLQEATSLIESLDNSNEADVDFINALSEEVSHLFNTLSFRMPISKGGKIFKKGSTYLDKITNEELALRAMSEQMVKYASFNFSESIDVDNFENDILQSVANAANMMGEELKVKVNELSKSHQEISSINKALDLSALVCITDFEGVFLKVNKAYCDASGYTEKELLGSSYELIASDFYSEQLIQEVQDEISSGRSWRGDVKNKAKDGSEYWVDVVVNPIIEVDGSSTRFLSIANLITDRKNQEERLIQNDKVIRSSLMEKEELLKEIHHRVKNNLQIISGLIKLQVKRTKAPEAIQVLMDSDRRITAISLVHEKLYQEDSLARLLLADYCGSIVSAVSGLYEGNSEIEFYSQLNSNIEISPSRAIPFALVINELISNAIKHAPKTENHLEKVDVVIGSKGDTIELLVKDNGFGIRDINDWRKSKSLGLKLVQSLALQLQGEFELQNNNGLEARLLFPIKTE